MSREIKDFIGVMMFFCLVSFASIYHSYWIANNTEKFVNGFGILLGSVLSGGMVGLALYYMFNVAKRAGSGVVYIESPTASKTPVNYSGGGQATTTTDPSEYSVDHKSDETIRNAVKSAVLQLKESGQIKHTTWEYSTNNDNLIGLVRRIIQSDSNKTEIRARIESTMPAGREFGKFIVPGERPEMPKLTVETSVDYGEKHEFIVDDSCGFVYEKMSYSRFIELWVSEKLNLSYETRKNLLNRDNKLRTHLPKKYQV